MFAKRVPARKWKEYQCEIAQYAEQSLVRHRTKASEYDGDQDAKKADGSQDERVEDIHEKV